VEWRESRFVLAGNLECSCFSEIGAWMDFADYGLVHASVTDGTWKVPD
jgi:hypothetical protein